MKGYGPETFGRLYAEHYDERLDMDQETQDSVDFLAELAGDGPVLELAIGTGRVALPLAARGLEVHGVEASEEMVARLRAKPGGEAIPVRIGAEFRLAYLVFNTIFNVTSQEAQVSLFQSVADHLGSGGAFVVETILPEVGDFGKKHQSVRGMNLAVDSVRFEVRMHDPVNQRIDYQRIVIDEKGAKLNPLAMRYVWPSEMDLMARLAGLELEHRYGWWDRSPFTADSTSHVSVYRKG